MLGKYRIKLQIFFEKHAICNKQFYPFNEKALSTGSFSGSLFICPKVCFKLLMPFAVAQ